MSELLITVNNIREETIARHYNAAFAELQDKIKAEPLRTKFDIYSGCISAEIAKEIAYRFELSGTSAVVETYGLFTTGWYLKVEISLPESLVHADEITSKVTDEVVSEAPVEPTTE